MAQIEAAPTLAIVGTTPAEQSRLKMRLRLLAAMRSTCPDAAAFNGCSRRAGDQICHCANNSHAVMRELAALGNRE